MPNALTKLLVADQTQRVNLSEEYGKIASMFSSKGSETTTAKRWSPDMTHTQAGSERPVALTYSVSYHSQPVKVSFQIGDFGCFSVDVLFLQPQIAALKREESDRENKSPISRSLN